MLERFRYSKPTAREERPKLTNSNFWWINNTSIDETKHDPDNINESHEYVGKPDNLSSSEQVLNDSYDEFIKKESKDIAKLHEKLNILRKKLFSNLNEKSTEDFDNELEVDNSTTVELDEDETNNSDDTTSNSDSIDSSLLSFKKPNLANIPKVKMPTQISDKLPITKATRPKVTYKDKSNLNVDSLDLRTKDLIERR
jgi:hypothetical protein